MRLEDLTAELRPRSDWEAVDLGLALARRDFWRLLGCWWLGMLPMLLVTFAFLRTNPLLLLFLCWWWIPVASRLVLFVLSRHLFGEVPSWKSILREWPRACVRRFGFRMLWARFSPWRPLTMAVEDLEGLRGKNYAARVRLLLRRGDSTVVMLALWRGALTVWMALAILGTAEMFLPAGESERWAVALDEWSGRSWFDMPPSLAWTGILSMLLSMSLVDIFSTGAGFGIYVNHRTWIEGWDVELAFRRLGNRLRGAAGALVAAIFVFLAPSADGEPTPKEVIGEIKADKDFTVHTETYTVPDPVKGGWNWSGEWLAGLGMVLFVLVIGALIGFVIWMVWRFRHVFRGDVSPAGKRVPPPLARVVMGMEVTPESLPPDIPARAMELWGVGRRQEAMSLLYRGAISRLIEGGGVEIAESDTESDCLRRVTAEAPPHSGYFTGLTEAWMKLAYARSEPPEETMRELCASWPFAVERSAP